MREAHRVLAEKSFQVRELDKGYAGRWLRVDLSMNTIEERPVTQEMKDLWIGGKGLDLWLTFQEVSSGTRWDSPENPICFSSGPLGGTASFPGSGKTLVTAISPTTHSMMDCNVGGYFGPYLKFAGFDALMLTGKGSEEIMVVIDAVAGRVAIEAAPLESIDSHVLSEELTEMYADDWLDRRNVAVVSAGTAADNTLLGMLNFSFYDWRRNVPRLKQAGRGGVGTVFRNKKLKALVLRNRDITPAWRVAPSAGSKFYSSKVAPDKHKIDAGKVQADIKRWTESGADAIELLYRAQNEWGHISRVVVDEVCKATKVPAAKLYHMVTFLPGFKLGPGRKGDLAPKLKEGDPDRFGHLGTIDHLCWFTHAQIFGDGPSMITADRRKLRQYIAPGAMERLEPLWRDGDVATLTRNDVSAALAGISSAPQVGRNERTTWPDLLSPHLPYSRDRRGMVRALAIMASSLARNSCGRCTPCREGLAAAASALERIRTKKGRAGDTAFVMEVCSTIKATSMCTYGKEAGYAIRRALESFGEEVGA